jgi:hypothetical protein
MQLVPLHFANVAKTAVEYSADKVGLYKLNSVDP